MLFRKQFPRKYFIGHYNACCVHIKIAGVESGVTIAEETVRRSHLAREVTYSFPRPRDLVRSRSLQVISQWHCDLVFMDWTIVAGRWFSRRDPVLGKGLLNRGFIAEC